MSLAGVAQTPRQKVLTVPYALKAASVNIESISSAIKTVEIEVKRFAIASSSIGNFGQPNSSFPLTGGYFINQYRSLEYGQWEIPNYVRNIRNIKVSYRTKAYGGVSGSVNLSIPGSDWGGITFSNQETLKTVTVPVNMTIPFGVTFCLQFFAGTSATNNTAFATSGAEITGISILADVPAVAVPF